MQYRFDQIAFNSTAKKKPTDDDKEHYIGLEHLDSDCLSVTRWGSDVAPTGEKLLMKKGDILFGKRRAYQRKVGIAPFDGIFSAHGMVLRPNEEVINKDFFPFFISSDQFMERAVRISVGGLSPTINWKDLREQEFELPSLDKQRVLADKLWAVYRLKESYKKLLVATDEMVKSQFIEMFGEPTYSVKTTLSDFVNLKAGKSKKADLIKDSYLVGSYPCYGGNGIRGYVSDYTHNGTYCIIGRQGAQCGNVQIAEGKFYATEHAVVVSPQVDVSPIWLFYALTQMNLNQYARGVAQPGLAVNQLERLPFSLPIITHQNQFAAIAQQADKSKFVGFKSQFIEMFGKGNWEQKCLGEIGTFKRGGGFQKSDYVEHGIPCIHYGQIHTKFGPFIYSHITEISTDLEPKTKFASKGDLIIAITSEDTEGSCKSTAWLGDYPVAVGGHAAIFHHCMNPLYMSFFFKSTLFNYAKMEHIHGTKVFEVKPDDIAKILVPCPPMSLQKQFSVIAQQADKSKFELRKSIEAIDAVIKSLINN